MRFPAVLCCVLLAAGAAIADPATVDRAYHPLALTAEQAGGDVELMRRALESIHPGLTRYATRPEIDAAFATLRDETSRPVTDLSLWRDIAVMLATLHCDHTKAEASDALDRYRRDHPTHLPLRFRLVEGRMIVVSADAQPGAPPPGAEIVAINGAAAPVVLIQLGRAVAYDGDTDQAIAAKLSSDSDLMGDDFNEYWPAFRGFADRWDLDWKMPGAGAIHHATLAPIGFDAWTRLAWPDGGYRDEFYRAVGWRLQGADAVLRIDTFVNYRNPVDADAFLGGFFKSMKAAGVKRLILDLRANGGGSEDVSLAFGRYLLPGPFVWSKPVWLKAIRYGDLPGHMETWGDRAAEFAPPVHDFRHLANGWWERVPRADADDDSTRVQAVSPDRFAGALTILTGPANGSGATRTIAQFKEKLGARLVGEDSGGSAEGPTAGHIFLLTLPASGLKVRIPNAWNRTNIASFTPRRGVAVDQLVVPTLADVAAGRDQALGVALENGPAPAAPELATALAGNWVGALEYRDFGDDRRATLPTRLVASADGPRATLAFTYDDGPGKTVRAVQRWSLSADGKSLRIEDGADSETFAVSERRGEADEGVALTLVADGAGQENGVAVRARIILTRRGERLWISRLSQKPGEPMLLRDGYSLERPSTGAGV